MNAIPPTRTATPGHPGKDSTETHPAYAMIGASRVSATPGYWLAGSDFRHQHFMTISIRSAELGRGLANDHWFGGRSEYIEVALSEAQWATFVSAPNIGQGVPCTVGRLNGELVPGIERTEDRREQFTREADESVRDALAALKDLQNEIEAMPLSAVKKKALLDKAQRAANRMTVGVQWIAKQFDEHTERTVEGAKIEVNAYITNAIQRAGLQALGAEPPVTLIGPGDE